MRGEKPLGARARARGVASLYTSSRPGPTHFLFDHSTACNKLCVVELE